MATVPMGDLLRLHALQKGDAALALVYPDEPVTWRELDERVNRRARLYREMGVRCDDFVTIALPNSPAFHEAAFAVWKLGATPNVVSASLPAHEFQAIVDLVDPRLVVGGPLDAAALGGRPRAPDDTELAGFSVSEFPSEVGARWRALTSGGSTGRPKVIIEDTPATFDPEAGGLHKIVGLPRDGVILNPGPLYHTAPFVFTSWSLFLGTTVVGMERFDAARVLALLARHRVQWVCFVPTMMHRIWSLDPVLRGGHDLSALETVWHMAAPCPPWLKRAWINWLGPDRIWELYGGTEGVGLTTINGREWLGKEGSVGRVHGRTRLQAFHDDGAACAAGEVGELYFQPEGGRIPTHYLGAEFKRLGEGWVTIGDLGWVDADGYVFLADRRTDLILRGGANIYPAEVEAAIAAHPRVASAVVVGLPCPDLGQRVHAIVQTAGGGGVEAHELHAFLESRLVRYKLPETYEFTSSDLRDDAGKVRRLALRDERARWLDEGRAFQLDRLA